MHNTKIAAITPTCSPERKPLLDFVKKRMKEQTMPVEHIIIDYPNNSGKPDLAKRFKEGITLAIQKGYEFILFIEDDDYYPLNYAEQMYNAWLREGKPVIIGNKSTYYYHFESQGIKIFHTNARSSAHCTGVSNKVNYKVGADDYHFYDLEIWKKNKGVLVELKKPVISIKHGLGLIGGSGHAPKEYKLFDKKYKLLTKWTDDEAMKLYFEILNPDHKDPTKHHYYDKIYSASSEYAKTNPATSIYFKLYQKVLEMLSPQAQIVELGCGTGLLAKLLIEKGFDYISGIDFSKVAISKAKQINPGHTHKFQVADIYQYKPPKEKTIICLEVLEHLAYDLKLIESLPATEFIFSVPDFMCDAHQRCFKSEQEIKNRYGQLLNIQLISNIKITKQNSVWIVKANKQ